MQFSTYQQQAVETAIYPKEVGLTYCGFGLCSEAGEVAGKIKKVFRDDKSIVTQERKMALTKELGDVLWYVAMLCTELDIELDEVARLNLAKLAERKQKNTLQGEGDLR